MSRGTQFIMGYGKIVNISDMVMNIFNECDTREFYLIACELIYKFILYGDTAIIISHEELHTIIRLRSINYVSNVRNKFRTCD